MDKLRSYLNQLSPSDQRAFADRAGTTIGYLRKALSVGQLLSEGLCIRIEMASDGALRAEDIRADVPWHVIRGKCDCKEASAP